MTTTQIKAGLPIKVTSYGKTLFNATAEIVPEVVVPSLGNNFTDPLWVGDWTPDVWGAVRKACQNNPTKDNVFIMYNIPGRDNGSYSAGGLRSPQEYYAWAGSIADAIGTSKSIVVVEPDALGLSKDLAQDKRDERFAMLQGAINSLKDKPNVKVFVDISMWRTFS